MLRMPGNLMSMQRTYLLLESADTFFLSVCYTFPKNSLFQGILFFNISTQTFHEVFRNMFLEDYRQSQKDS